MLRIEIDTSNAAFADGTLSNELVSCLDRVESALRKGKREGAIMDTNGNRVGHFTLTLTEED